MLTVNSPVRAMNSLVPSSGSTSQKRPPAGAPPAAAAALSSEITGMCGAAARSPATIRLSAARSASVTGEPSSLIRTAAPSR